MCQRVHHTDHTHVGPGTGVNSDYFITIIIIKMILTVAIISHHCQVVETPIAMDGGVIVVAI